MIDHRANFIQIDGFDAQHLPFLRRCVRWSTRGGHSDVRQGEERQEKCGEDQGIGWCAELAISLLLFGSSYNFILVQCIAHLRLKRKQNPGDRGIDIFGHGIDIKGSAMNSERKGTDPLAYNCIADRSSWRESWAYVQVMFEAIDLDTDPAIVKGTVIGWTVAEKLKPGPEWLKGARVLEACHLYPLHELKERMDEFRLEYR